MSIIKNEIPILEFDTEQTAVISPVHENLNLVLPKKCVFAFLGEYIDEYAEKTGAQIVSYFIQVHKPLNPYKILKNLCFFYVFTLTCLIRTPGGQKPHPVLQNF